MGPQWMRTLRGVVVLVSISDFHLDQELVTYVVEAKYMAQAYCCNRASGATTNVVLTLRSSEGLPTMAPMVETVLPSPIESGWLAPGQRRTSVTVHHSPAKIPPFILLFFSCSIMNLTLRTC